jgi:hypothetical protein
MTLNPCPMCGSPVEIDATGSSECYGYTWQTAYIECTQKNDEHCGMRLELHADMWYTSDDSWEALQECWNTITSGRGKNK